MFWFRRPQGWCCEYLQRLYEARYDQGMFVFAAPPVEGVPHVTFWFAMRSVQHEDIAKLVGNVPITVSTSRVIRYCPWCRANLLRHYAHQYQMLVDPVIVQEFNLS